MPGPVASTAVWALDTDQVLLAGVERLRRPATGYDIDKGIKALQFTFQRLATMGLNLWTIEKVVLDLTEDQPDYTLPADTMDVLEMVLRDASQANAKDIPVERMPRDTYAYIVNKAQAGDPSQAYVERNRDAPTLWLWPVPGRANLQLVYWRIRLFRDVGGMLDGLDVPTRWTNILVAGVAWYLSLTSPETTAADRAEHKAAFDEEIAVISPEDRDRGPFEVQIDLSSYYRV